MLMGKRRARRCAVGAACVLASILVGSQVAAGQTSEGVGPQARAATPSQLNIGLSSILEVFDPAVAQPVAKVHLDLLYDHVVGLNDAGTAFSKATGVASNWSTKDNQTWVFTIRRGIKFSN